MNRFEHQDRTQHLPDAMKNYAVDFDDTLAHQIWPEPGCGEPIEENLIKLNEVAEAGHPIWIHTARPWGDYHALERWLAEHQVPYHAIVLGKLTARRYIDDKALNASEPSWIA
jgi:hypothetical protein